MATMNSGLGGSAGYGENSFQTNGVDTGNLDDGAIQVDVTSVFGAGGVDFFGSSYTDVWINSNGLITFDSANTSYQPSGIGGLNQPAIAPFWSDIDITKGGDIYWDLDPGAGALTVTWLDVRPYDSNNSSTNSFQMVLTDTGDGNFSVEFIYEDIDWAYGGTGSGGGPATAGVTDGGSNDYEVDGSGDGSAVLDWDNEDFDGAGGDEAGVFSVSIVGGVVSSTVEGTEGADVFGLGISDIFGNAVTTGDDVINVAGGDDLVDGAGGDDTILGGSGNDTILSGSWGGGSFTPVYSEQTGASDSFFGSNGNSGFTGTTTSNGPLSTASFGSISGYYLGQSNDTFETHTHTFSQEIAGAQILFNDAQSNEVVSLVLDGQFVNLNTAISEGWVTFDGNGQYLINGSGQITSGSNAASTVVGTLTIDASFTSAQLNYQSNSSGDGVHYEFYVDTNPVAAGSDDDLLDGGADADTFLLDDNFGNDTIVGGETGTDTDIIDASDLADALSFALSGTGEGTFSIGTDTVTFSEIEGFELTDQADSVDASADAGGLSIDAGAGDDTVIGGSGDDTIIGGLGADSLLGGDGADTFVIADGFGADTIQGGEGGTDVDEIDLSALSSGISVAFVDGGAGTIALGGDTIQFSEIESFTLTEQGDVFTATNNDHGVTVDGGSGSDTITGARGDHTLFGGDGDDAIYGGNGQSSIDGGSGNDTVYANFYSVTAKPNSYSGGSGTDTLMIAGTAVGSVAYNINLQTGIDTYNNSYSGFEHIVFGTGNDTVLGDAGDNLFEGGDGSDSLMGALGSDTLIGGEGNDFLSGGEGDDFLKSGQGQDTLDGGDGADTLMNAAGDDSLVGGAGDDLIVATQGSDTLEGGAGQDTLMGGVDGDSLDGGADNDLLLGDLAGVRFNETGNDGIGIATNIADFPTTQLSFELTFSSTADPTGTAALGSYVADSGGASLNLYTQSGSLMIEIGGNVVNTGISTASLFDGNVQTLALTWDSASGALEVYDNGSSAYTGTVAAGASFDQGGTFVLGQYQLNEGSYVVGAEFDGTIYGARIYNDIRTPSEILDSTQGPVADTSDSNLVSNWVADPEFAGFNDLSDNAYTMAMLGDVSLAWSEGADTLIGGSGEDTLYGGGGADSVDGGSGQDSILGGDGDDTIDGGGNTDTIFGGAGDDLIADTGGGASDDTIYGEAGNDTISGGVREDYLDGGDDADTFLIEDGPGNDTIIGGEGTTTGSDHDVINLSGITTQGVTVTYTGDEAGTIVVGSDTITFSETEEIGLTEQADVVDATDSAFTQGVNLDGAGGDDTIIGTDFGDTIAGGDGDDSIEGGLGDDFLTTGLGNDTLMGGQGNDTLMNSDGDDSLDGGDGDDSIVATGGEDTLRGGAGDDTMDGGADADTFIIEDGFGNDVIVGGETTTDPGDSDFDTIDLSVLSGPVTVTYTGDEAGTITNGTDTITFSEIERIILTDQADVVDATADNGGAHIDGGAGDDTITTGDGNDTVFYGGGDNSVSTGDGNDYVDDDAGNPGYTGNNTVDLGDGNDTIYSGYGDDSIQGGSGDDVINAQWGDDTVDGGDGNDYIQSEEGDTSLSGGAGNDTIIGATGRDTIRGGTGDDSLYGGNDQDTFIVEDGFGDDTIQGGEGGTDDDVIDLSHLSGPVTVTYTGDEAGTITDGTDTITFSEIERIILTDQADSVDGNASSTGINIEGGAGDDTIEGGDTGTGANDTIDGGAGDDSIDAGRGDDQVQGSIGNDTIEGWNGNDSLDGGEGNDSLNGGVGDDTIEGGDGNDTIDADQGNDSVSGGDGDDSLDGWNGDDTIEGGSGNDTLRGLNDNDSLDGGSGDDSLEGGSGNDTLAGGTGDDVLTGGAGNDTFVFEVGDGADTITDFNFGNSGALNDGDTSNNDFIDLSQYYTNLSEMRADFDDDGVLNQSNDGQDGADYSDNTRMQSGDSAEFSGAQRSSFTSDNTGVVCFATGTLILTDKGEVPIERLRPEDRIVTMDNGLQPLAMVASRRLGAQDLADNPQLKPIELKAGALGAARSLIVSPQHAMLVQVEGGERLVRARQLSRLHGGSVRVMQGCRQVTYVHLLFDAHQIVFANGRPSESFYPGPLAMAALDRETRAEFEAVFPTLSREVAAYGGNSSFVAARTPLRSKNLPTVLADVQQPKLPGFDRTL